jgi:hypothetical protein
MKNLSLGTPVRRSERVWLRIPIRVEGKDMLGAAIDETTYTLVVNRSGGLIVLDRSLQPGAQIRITNLTSHVSCSFEVVMRSADSLSGKPEWGVKCLKPELEIWGVHFPPRSEQFPQPDLTHVLVECGVCVSREMAALAEEQYRWLVAHSSLPRHCTKCGIITEWRFTDLEVGLGAVSPSLAGPSASGLIPQGADKSTQEKRLAVKLPLEVRLPDGREETSTTENISESSICFASTFELQIGDRIYVSLGLDPPEEQCDIPARIIWQCPPQGKARSFYGAKLESVDQAGAAGYRLRVFGSPRNLTRANLNT